MADVTGDPSDRGQLFLVGGLSLAVILVVLAVTLNSAIYTENLATRGSGTADTDAVEQARSNAVHGVEGLMEHTIEANPSSYTDQQAAVDSGVSELHTLSRRYAAQNGRLVELTYGLGDDTRGVRVLQTTDATFEDDDGNDSWTVATDVPAVRQFRMDVERSSLNDGVLSDSFNITFTPTSGPVYEVVVGRTILTDETTVSVYRDGSLVGRCSDGTGSQTTIDVTGATVAGSYCPALTFFGDLPPTYNITYENADDVRGTYELTVEKAIILDAPYGGGGPTKQPALYSTTVGFYFESNRFVYETELRVAPGEPDV